MDSVLLGGVVLLMGLIHRRIFVNELQSELFVILDAEETSELQWLRVFGPVLVHLGREHLVDGRLGTLIVEL